jgi:hypothetical protein
MDHARILPFGEMQDPNHDSFRQQVTSDQLDLLRSDAAFRFPITSRFPWDDFAGVASAESQILSPPDLFALPLFDAQPQAQQQKEKQLYDNSTSTPAFNLSSMYRNWFQPPVDPAKKAISFQELVVPVSQPKRESEAVVEAPVPQPSVSPSTESESVSSPLQKGSKKKSRKKGRPELQRKKRGEMNDRFSQLKVLLRDDISQSTVIGRGDRSTNSKEAILRIAATRITTFQKEIAALEKQVAAATASNGKKSQQLQPRASSSTSCSTVQSSKADSNTSSESILDHHFLYAQSSIARLLVTLDGAVVAANDLIPPMMDLDKSQFKALKGKETVFTVTHPECLPAVFANLSDLLSGTRCVTYLVDAKGIVTWRNRIPVCSVMSWVSYGAVDPATGQRAVYIDSLIVQTGWCIPSAGDVKRLCPVELSSTS